MSPRRNGKGFRVGVVGATGMVGLVLLERLAARRFPVEKLLPFSSGRKKVSVGFRGRTIPAPGVDVKSLLSADLVFLVSSDEVSKKYAKQLSRAGVWVIDDSSQFRMDPDVPLVIPGVNEDALTAQSRLIAGPNCTTSGLAVAGFPLHKKARIKRVRIASYQAVSGAGREALLEFYAQLRMGARKTTGTPLLPKLPRASARELPEPIALNLFPHIGAFNEIGESGEELKVRAELRRIWAEPSLQVSATAVRVPVIRGHSLAVWIETAVPVGAAAARKLLAGAPGVQLWKPPRYPTVSSTAGTDPVHVGRIRPSGTGSRELAMWIVSDNLLIGAALNSIRIAEHLFHKGWVTK